MGWDNPPMPWPEFERLFELDRYTGTAVIATGNVHYAAPQDARLAPALAAIRARRSLDEMDGWLAASGGAYTQRPVVLTARQPAELAALMEQAEQAARRPPPCPAITT
jgi:error-prone DNA polymerase